MSSMFIRVDVNNDLIRKKEGLAAKLEEVCPVNIFKADGPNVSVVEENQDECTLCELCIKASPDGVKVVKLYE